MPSLSLTIKQTEEVLGEVSQLVEEEYEKPNSVLSETDRNKFVGEEQSLRKRLKESESNSSWRVQSLFSKRVPSPQAKCLEEAKDLHQRIKHYIRSKWGTRFTAGRSNALGLSLMGTRALETDTPADGNPERVSTIVMSPLNIPASEASQPNVVDAAVRNDRDHSSDLNEAISTPIGTSIDAPTPRSPPPPLPPRRMAQTISSEATGNLNTPDRSLSVRRLAPPPPPQSPSCNSYILSETTDTSSTPSLGRSPSIRRTPPPPPQSPSRNSHILSKTTDSTGTPSPGRSPSIRRLPPPPPQSPSRNPHILSETTDSTPCCTVTLSPARSPSVRRPAPPPPLSPLRNSRILSEITDNPGTLSDSIRGAAPPPPQSPARSASIRRPAPPPPLSPSRNSHISPETTDLPGTRPPGRTPSIRRPAPLPPQSPLRNSFILPETTANPGTVPLGRSSSVKQQPPQSPRRQSRTPVPITISLPSGTIYGSAQAPLDPATLASITQLVERVVPFATSMAAQAQTATTGNGRAHGRRSSAYVSKTNCMDISNSTVEGLTMNNGGSHNSGAVINKGVMPTTRSSRQVPVPLK